jgi:tetratricopeptide (TPR) repeat protein
MELALRLDPGDNVEYRRFHNIIKGKIEELNNKTEKYKSWLKDAEDYSRNGNLDKALNAYKHAQEIFDSAEIRHTIVEIEDEIKKQEKNSKVLLFLNNAEIQLKNGKFNDAVNSVNSALELDPANQKAKETLQQIYTLQNKIETDKKYKELINLADILFKESSLDEAVEKYNKALEIKTSDKYCTEQLQKIKDLIQQKENQGKAKKILAEADRLFADENWESAKSKYEEAHKLCPQDKDLQDKIKQCVDKIKDQEDVFGELLLEATLAEKKGSLSNALTFLEKALKMKPDDTKVKSRIKKIKFDLEFIESKTNDKEREEDGFLKTNTTGKIKEDDFLKTNAKKNETKALFCTHCGAKLNAQDQFCFVCGKIIKK